MLKLTLCHAISSADIPRLTVKMTRGHVQKSLLLSTRNYAVPSVVTQLFECYRLQLTDAEKQSADIRDARLEMCYTETDPPHSYKNLLFRLRDFQFFQTVVTNLSYQYDLQQLLPAILFALFSSLAKRVRGPDCPSRHLLFAVNEENSITSK